MVVIILDNICGNYPIHCDEKVLGEVKIEKVNIRYNISSAVNNIDMPRPFRLAAICGDKIIPLGVMMPDRNGFSYSRSFSSAALSELGIDTIDGFTLITDSSPRSAAQPIAAPAPVSAVAVGWQQTDTPGEYFEDGEFRHIFSGCKSALVRNDGETQYLAIPVLKDEPFPAMPVFCLGEVWKINEKLHLVFKIHEGKLLF